MSPDRPLEQGSVVVLLSVSRGRGGRHDGLEDQPAPQSSERDDRHHRDEDVERRPRVSDAWADDQDGEERHPVAEAVGAAEQLPEPDAS